MHPHPLLIFVLILWSLWIVVRLHESNAMRDFCAELIRLWKSAGVPGRIIAIAMVVMCTQYGGSKGFSPAAGVMRMLFWHPSSTWQLLTAYQAASSAAASAAAATNKLATAEAATNQVVYTLSFDWHAPDRLPYHAEQNVLAYTPWVFPTNIEGVLYEDHCVAFNATASTNPAVIMIEYARKSDDGSVERYTSSVVTSSYPNTRVVNLQSGSYTCYWFRCAVPLAFTNSVRNWNGEALFGAPYDSGKGFDLLGTLVVDAGNNVWVGANTNMIIGTTTNVVRNGVITED